MNIEKDNKVKLGLALSGGGYRAAAFHLGVLRKLNKMNLLDKLHVISTISGGSIAGASYAINKDNFEEFELSFETNLQKSIIQRIIWSFGFWVPVSLFLCFAWFLLVDPMDFVLPGWLTAILFSLLIISPLFFQFSFLNLTKLKAKAYKSVFFGNKVIDDLPPKPIIAINATNLSTGMLWTFSKNKTSDSSYEFPPDESESIKFNCGKFPLALAVASSTSVPVPFNPVKIDKKYFAKATDYDRVRPLLIDGGLYDNQGIHKITQQNSSYHCDIIIVSDGSEPFRSKFKAWSTGFILYRGVDVMMRKIKNLQFIRDVYSQQKEIAYFSLDWRYKKCILEFVKAAKRNLIHSNVLNHHGITTADLSKPDDELALYFSKKIDINRIVADAPSVEQINDISLIKTNLTALSLDNIQLLSKHGEVLTEIQIKLYCPSLLK